MRHSAMMADIFLFNFEILIFFYNSKIIYIVKIADHNSIFGIVNLSFTDMDFFQVIMSRQSGIITKKSPRSSPKPQTTNLLINNSLITCVTIAVIFLSVIIRYYYYYIYLPQRSLTKSSLPLINHPYDPVRIIFSFFLYFFIKKILFLIPINLVTEVQMSPSGAMSILFFRIIL